MDDAALLSRIEDAGLNASAPPQQRWLDGWLLRFSPGKAKRARCINAVAAGRLPFQHKLDLAAAAYREAGLPMVVRVTPFSEPPDIDTRLAERGFTLHDPTRVMVRTPPAPDALVPPPSGTRWSHPTPTDFAEAVGLLRGTPQEQRQAHAQRLAMQPVQSRCVALIREDVREDRNEEAGATLACGQFVREAELVGLYDVFTREAERGRGLATLLCRQLLAIAAAEGGRTGYLQVDAENDVARRIYARLGFTDRYAYHYRHAPGQS